MASAETRTGIVVVPRVFAMPFWRWVNEPCVTIDGTAHNVDWRAVFFPVAPGTHQVEVCIRMFLFWKQGKAKTTVEVIDGQTVQVNYKARWLVFLPGKITVVQTQPS